MKNEPRITTGATSQKTNASQPRKKAIVNVSPANKMKTVRITNPTARIKRLMIRISAAALGAKPAG